MTEQEWWKPCVAEFLGVFALVFLGAGSIITLNQVNGGTMDTGGFVGVALAHGLAIAVMVIAVGHISGGHFNPAVTIAALFTRRIKTELGLLYIVFQLLGAVFGAFMLISAFPATWWKPVALGTPSLHPALDPAKGVLVEAVLTFFLVLVIFGAAIDERNHARVLGGLAIGLTITVDILMGGLLTGAAMNPARWFGPALLTHDWSLLYLYVAGPVLGGIVAGLVYDSAYFPRRRVEASPDSSTKESAPPPSMP